MTETVELVDQPVVASAAAEPARPQRLFQVAAWVAIVAGTLFIVATVFFAGFFMGRHSGHHGYGHGYGRGGGHHSMQGGFGGPGMMPPWGPGMGPGMGQMGPPTESPSTNVPPRPSP